jgi:bacteriocin-like protein
MKSVVGQSENTFENFGFETLNENEMRQILGGDKKSKAKDIYDFDEEEG